MCFFSWFHGDFIGYYLFFFHGFGRFYRILSVFLLFYGDFIGYYLFFLLVLW